MIDSVLVERTVKEVLPALKTTLEKLVETMQGIANAYSAYFCPPVNVIKR